MLESIDYLCSIIVQMERNSSYVRPKKALGQHFLTDQGIARSIVEALDEGGQVLEVGPGTGVLTQYLLERQDLTLKAIEVDDESVRYLLGHFPKLGKNLYEADFLKIPLEKVFEGPFNVIGNFPYNISSQIFFRILDYRTEINEVVCMIQKEVAERIATGPGSKTYGILSVLLQAWYDIEYLFSVSEGAFLPPPKVKSAVIRLKRNGRTCLEDREGNRVSDENFKRVVKTAFNQRRKTLRNSLKPLLSTTGSTLPETFASQRPEQLSVEDFIELTSSL